MFPALHCKAGVRSSNNNSVYVNAAMIVQHKQSFALVVKGSVDFFTENEINQLSFDIVNNNYYYNKFSQKKSSKAKVLKH